MPYSSTTYGQLQIALENRLNDTSNNFWSLNEIQSYLIEALRTWNIHAATYVSTVNLSTVANTLYYDMFELFSALVPSVTDAQIARDISFVLQEPYNYGGQLWIGTEQFSVNNVYQAIKQRMDKFLLETGLVTSVANISSITTMPITLPQGTIDVRHVLWNDGSQYYVLFPLDFETTASQPYLEINADTPQYYRLFPERPLEMDVVPPPSVTPGAVSLLVVKAGPTLNPSSPTILGIPDDLCWVIKMGALADLFATEGPGQDVARAQYFESRWNDGIELARISNYVRIGHNNSVPWYIDSIEEMDSGDPLWVSQPQGPPSTLAVAGNIIATGPVADNVYPLDFYILPNFPIPSLSGDFIQVGPEVIDVILDYAQHLANAKEGAAELSNSKRQLQNLVKLAMVQNDRLRAQAQNLDVFSDRGLRNMKENPRRKSDLDLQEMGYPK